MIRTAHLPLAFVFLFSQFSALANTDLITGQDLLGGPAVHVTAAHKKGVVAVFMSSTCPCSDSHVPEIVALARDYPAFQFVGIHSNPSENEQEARSYFQSKKLPFPVIQDRNTELADRFKALKTPHAFLISPDGTIQFQGGVSNRSDFAHADQKYLRKALEKYNQGQKPEGESTRTLGCPIRRKS